MIIHKFNINKTRQAINSKFPIFFKLFVFHLIIFSGFVSIRAQSDEIQDEIKSKLQPFYSKTFDNKNKFSVYEKLEKIENLLDDYEIKHNQTSAGKEIESKIPDFSFAQETEVIEKIKTSEFTKSEVLKYKIFLTSEQDSSDNDKHFDKFYEDEIGLDDSFSNERYKEKFHWKPALIQSGIFLGIQHGFRLMQKKTFREFDGPFFKDWATSVKNLRGWADGDSTMINYIAHPLQGGITGRIFINNSDNAKRQQFSQSKEYWESRFKTFVWSAVWSTQFELGPLSEATIGNVGLLEKNGHSSMAWIDMVVTPVIGTGVVIGEDAIDRYILKNWLEKKKGGRVTPKIKFFRSLLTPATTFSNLLRGKYPWHRDFR